MLISKGMHINNVGYNYYLQIVEQMDVQNTIEKVLQVNRSEDCQNELEELLSFIELHIE